MTADADSGWPCAAAHEMRAPETEDEQEFIFRLFF
jgi:hypothetical protein